MNNVYYIGVLRIEFQTVNYLNNSQTDKIAFKTQNIKSNDMIDLACLNILKLVVPFSISVGSWIQRKVTQGGQ